MKNDRKTSATVRLLALVLVMIFTFSLAVTVSAEQDELYYTDFDGAGYDGMNDPVSNGTAYIIDQLLGTDFTVEAVINIKSIKNDSGRGVKFILRECPVASSEDLEVWIGAYDIWACTDGWKGNGTAKGFTVDPYLEQDITVRLDVKGDTVYMYIDEEMIWTWTDPTFSAGGETYLEFGGWDAKYVIKSIRVLTAPEDGPQLDEEHVDPEPAMGGTIYYVDSNAPAGGDGLSPETAWRTITQVNAHDQFLPDDQILFRRGCVWTGYTLSPKGYGIEGHPIIIDSYGEGDLPIIDRQGKFTPGKTNGSSTVVLTNQSYWTFRNIQISNHNPENPGTLEDVYVTDTSAEFVMRHGVVIQSTYVASAAKKVVRGIVFENVVFDGIDTSHGDEGNCFVNRIKNISAGSGGGALCFRATDSADGNSRAYIDGITVDGCTFHNIGGTAVSTGGGWKYFDTFSGVEVRNNLIYNDPEAPLSCSGIYIVSTHKPLVENNVIRDMTNGIGFQLCDDVTAQYNTVINVDGYLELTSRYSGKAQYWDGCGIDADCGCRGTTKFIGNYLERCREGSFAFFDYKDTSAAMVIIEDNISYNCGSFMYYQCNNAMYDFVVCNNTIVRMPGAASNPQTSPIHIYSGELDRHSIMFRNNVFWYPNQIVNLTTTGCGYAKNLYEGVSNNVGDNNALSGDPLLILPSDHADTANLSVNGTVAGTTSLTGSGFFQFGEGSPCVSDGEVVCGARLSGEVTPPADPTDPSEPGTQDTTPPASTGPSNNDPAPGSSDWIVPVVIAIIILCTGVAVFFILRPKKS